MKKLFFFLTLFIFTSHIFAQASKNKSKNKNQTKISKQDSIIIAMNNKVYTEVQELPQFPGGDKALVKFISDNIVYPEKEKNSGIKGRVTVSFVIDRDGNVKNPVVKEGIEGYPAFEKEALRVVSILPKWIPAKHMGRRVACLFTLPIDFTL